MSLIYSNIPELEGTDTEITLANLSRLECELERLFEKRIAHLCELASAIVRDGGDIDLIKSIILSIRSDGEIDTDRISSDNTKEIVDLFSKISLIERLIVFKEIFGSIAPETLGASEDHIDITSDAKNRIAYVKNSYNDTVFGHFASLLDDAKALYPESTIEVCESVLVGKAQYCILPVETMRDGRLISFYEAIINYDLKICAEYDLINSDGTGYTRYTLLGSDTSYAIRSKRSKDAKKYLEITYSEDNASICELINAAEYLDLYIESVDTLVMNDVSEKKRICIVFSGTEAAIDSFAVYLNVDYPDILIIGKYQRL